MTKLEAVNQMLLLIGEAPVNSLSNSDFQPAYIAKVILEDTTLALLGKKWNFNTTLKEKIYKEVDNCIYIPTTAIRCVPSMPDRGIVLKGNKLYDLVDNTFEFSSSITYVECDVTYAYDFEDCPVPFQQWVAICAGRKFETRMLKTGSMYQLTEKEERDAKASFLQYDTELINPTIFDNYRTGAVVNRQSNPLPYSRL